MAASLALVRPRSDARWYDREAQPVTSVPYADPKRRGETRRPDLRDARKRHLYPSVTTVLRVIDQPGIRAWETEQHVLSALTLPRHDGESVDAFARRVVEDANAERNAAREEGATLHDLIRDYLLGRGTNHAGEYRATMRLFEVWWQSSGYQCLAAEQRFVHPELGYGGMVDCIATQDGQPVIIDWKTTGRAPGKPVTFYPEWAVQLAAYERGLGMDNARLVSVVVSRDVPGLIEQHVWTDYERWWAAYHAAFVLWQLLNNYYPGAAA